MDTAHDSNDSMSKSESVPAVATPTKSITQSSTSSISSSNIATSSTSSISSSNIPTNGNKSTKLTIFQAILMNDTSRLAELLDSRTNKYLLRLKMRDSMGRTPLYFAAQHGKLDVVQRLVITGANLEEPDSDGWTPLFVACMNGHEAEVEFLLSHNAKTCSKETKYGWTPIFAAISKNWGSIVKLLIGKGASVNIQDNAGRTPLWIATMMGHFNIAKELISKGADVNTPDEKRRTPAYIAVQMSRKECLAVLIDANANLELTDIDNRTPLVLAYRLGLDDIRDFLIEKGAEKSSLQKMLSEDSSLETEICSGKLLSLVSQPPVKIVCFTVQENFGRLWGGATDGTLLVWDLETQNLLATAKGVPTARGTIQDMITVDDEVWVCGSKDIFIWKWKDGPSSNSNNTNNNNSNVVSPRQVKISDDVCDTRDYHGDEIAVMPRIPSAGSETDVPSLGEKRRGRNESRTKATEEEGGSNLELVKHISFECDIYYLLKRGKEVYAGSYNGTLIILSTKTYSHKLTELKFMTLKDIAPHENYIGKMLSLKDKSLFLVSVKKYILILGKKEDQPADPPIPGDSQNTINGMAFSLKGVLKGHSDSITDMVEVPAIKIQQQSQAQSQSQSQSQLQQSQAQSQSQSQSQHSLHISLPHQQSSTSSYVWTSSRDMSIRIWDIDKKILVKEIPNAHKTWVQTLCVISPSQVLSGAYDGKIKSWDTKSYNSIEFPTVHSNVIQSMFYSHKKGVLWVGSIDKTMSLWQ